MSQELNLLQNKIYEIRGQKGMFDFDIAELYGVETKRLKEAVRRNRKRFPTDFMFEISQNEMDALRTQFASLKKTGRGQHIKYPPFAFTEHGVTMLASILNSDKAIEMNIVIVRAFVALRQITLQNHDLSAALEQLRKEINERLGGHDAQLNAI